MRGSRVVAVVEVCIAFCAAHVAFRAFRRFTALGQEEVAARLNFSPGAALIAVALLFVLLPRRRLADHGLTARNGATDVALALLALTVVAAGGILAMSAGLAARANEMGPTEGLVYLVGGILVIAAILALARRLDARLARARGWLTGLVVGVFLVLPAAGAAVRGADVPFAALTTAWLFLGAGFGEEIFFRGYVQSRLNAAFGRPWQWFGVRFGVGLVGAALLFGLVHALNTVDYFAGTWEFRWWHALATFAAPYGFLREKTGSIVAPAILHGLIDVIGNTGRLVQGVR